MSALYPDFAMHPRLAGLTADAVELLCVIILAHPARDSWPGTDREFVDSFLELQDAGLVRIVTDGENTDGIRPERVAEGIGRRPESERPSIYFVAFDVEASRFARVRDAGGLILPAANARELNDTLDALLRGKILLEK